jgi:uncharacterized protein (TIGR00645 family)
MNQVTMPPSNTRPWAPTLKSLIEGILFNVKWVLPVFYLGLVLILILFGYVYLKELLVSARLSLTTTSENMEIVVLNFVDVVMIANLAKMIITGSYNSFVSKEHGRLNENISSGTLKIKIATTIVIVSALHLLRELVARHSSTEEVEVQLSIFAGFLLTTLVLGILEYLHAKQQSIEAEIEAETDVP